MTEQTITIYCFIDDFFRAIGRKDDAHCKINDAEVLTTALLAARYFHGNLHSACCYMKEHHGVKMIDSPVLPVACTDSKNNCLPFLQPWAEASSSSTPLAAT